MRVSETYLVLSIVALAGGLLLGGWRLAARITRLIDAVTESTREIRRLRRHGRRQSRRIDALEARMEALEARRVRIGSTPGGRSHGAGRRV